uniref:EF-hand domain-containing protein n=1 Tax=Amblyomma triste TaxID=251400 RepID=A0A023G6D3_AMBTT
MSGFRHRHLYTFHNFWDCNKDGILTWDDFNTLAENYTKLQRRGKLEKEVYERWKMVLERWWNELTEHADFNKDHIVEFDEWLKFFTNLGKSTKSVKDLPDFLQKYLHLFFLIMDSNKDGLVCAKDYKKYLKTHNLDISRADECFKEMLNEEDIANGDAMTSDRFTATVYDCWVSQDNNCKGRYICGLYDSSPMEELEKKNKKRPV